MPGRYWAADVAIRVHHHEGMCLLLSVCQLRQICMPQAGRLHCSSLHVIGDSAMQLCAVPPVSGLTCVWTRLCLDCWVCTCLKLHGSCVQGSLAKLAGSGVSYTVALCLLGPAVMPVLVICRVAAQPPYLWAMGMISCLVYGLTLITGRAAFPIDRFWGSTVAFVLVVALLSAGVAVLASLLVLPTLATDEVWCILQLHL